MDDVRRLFLDERVHYMTIGRFKAKVKSMGHAEFSSFKHWENVYQVEEEAVLVPYSMYLQIQAALVERETKQ